MKFYQQSLLLFFFILLHLNFINAKRCLVGGDCYLNGQHKDLNPSGERKECDDNICYSYKCINPDGHVMFGGGCYEDFVNTCKFIQSKITENARGNGDYQYYDENVVVVSCHDDNINSCIWKGYHLYESSEVFETFGKNHIQYFSKEHTCHYNTTALPTKSQVQCRQGGQCVTDNSKLDVSAILKYPNVTCSECVAFNCLNEDKTIYGHGCLEDFERICTNIPTNVLQKIKANPKNYFYTDNSSIIMLSCSYGDNCQIDAAELYFKSLPPGYTVSSKFDKHSDNICSYEPLLKQKQQNKNSAPESEENPFWKQKEENRSNDFEISGIIIFGICFTHLWFIADLLILTFFDNLY